MSSGNLADTTRPLSQEKIDAMRASAIGQDTYDGYTVTEIGSPIVDEGKFTDSYASVQLTHPDGDEKTGLIRFIGKNIPDGAIEHHKLINQLDPTLMPQILGHSETAIILDSKLLQTGTNKFWDNAFDHLALDENLERNYKDYLLIHTDLMIRLAKAGEEIQNKGGLKSTAAIYPAAGWHAPLKNELGNENFANIEPRIKDILEHAAAYRETIEKRIEQSGPEFILAGNTQPGLVRLTSAGAILQSVETNFAQIAYAMRHPNVQPSANRYKDDLKTCITLTNNFDRQATIKDQAEQFNAAGLKVEVCDIAAATMLHSARMIIGQLGVINNENNSDIDRAAANAFTQQLAQTYEQLNPVADLNNLEI